MLQISVGVEIPIVEVFSYVKRKPRNSKSKRDQAIQNKYRYRASTQRVNNELEFIDIYHHPRIENELENPKAIQDINIERDKNELGAVIT